MEQSECSTDANTKLRERFQVVMQEIEIEEGYKNYSELTEKVLERCFSYKIAVYKNDGEFPLKEIHPLTTA